MRWHFLPCSWCIPRTGIQPWTLMSLPRVLTKPPWCLLTSISWLSVRGMHCAPFYLSNYLETISNLWGLLLLTKQEDFTIWLAHPRFRDSRKCGLSALEGCNLDGWLFSLGPYTLHSHLISLLPAFQISINLNKIKLKIQLLSCSSHIGSSQ